VDKRIAEFLPLLAHSIAAVDESRESGDRQFSVEFHSIKSKNYA